LKEEYRKEEIQAHLEIDLGRISIKFQKLRNQTCFDLLGADVSSYIFTAREKGMVRAYKLKIS
jgi:hypothetical protein